jgi:hypothetical protein
MSDYIGEKRMKKTYYQKHKERLKKKRDAHREEINTKARIYNHETKRSWNGDRNLGLVQLWGKAHE